MGTEPKLEILRDISLRDWFAGMALQGILANQESSHSAGFDAFAECAYRHADAMLAERSK